MKALHVTAGMAAFFLILFCVAQRIDAADQKVTVIKTSAPSMPDWVLKKKKSPEYVYFVGMSSKSPDMKSAKKEAIDDAASQLIEYIGFRATARFKSTKEMADSDNVSSFSQNIEQTLEGKGSANVNIDLEDFYYEQYSDNTITMYCLIKFPQDWVEKERARLQKLVSDQHRQAEEYLNESSEELKNGNLSRALDLSLSALIVSEKAAENSDLYDQAKNTILLELSSLSVTLEGTPKYAYREGGSDPIRIRAISSKTSGSVPGLMIDINEQNTNALLASKKGNTTDEKGEVEYSVDKIVNNSADKLLIYSSLSLAKFGVIKNFDPDFYSRLLEIQDKQALRFSLSPVKRDKVITTALVIFDMSKEGKQDVKNGLSPKFQESVSGKLADAGYNIISVEVPASVISSGREEGKIRQAIINYLKANYPGAIRLLIGIRQINYLGEIGKDIIFKDYNLNDSQLKSVEVKFILSFISMETGKTEKGVTLEERGTGLNVSQALDIATKRITDKLNGELDNL